MNERGTVELPLQIAPALCVHARGLQQSDALCWRVCPTNAIRVQSLDTDSPGPLVDFETCVKCGLCAQACPVGVFEDVAAQQNLEEAIVERLRTDLHLSFRCSGPHSRDSAPATNRKERAKCVPVICLGVLDESLLLFAAARGAESISFHTDRCSGCSWRRGLVLLRRAAVRAEQILRIFDRELRMQFLSEAPPAFAEAPLKRAGISRREFFQQSWRTGLRRRKEDFRDSHNELTKVRAAVMRRRPRHRLQLHAAARLLGEPRISSFVSGEVPVWSIAVNDACDCCGSCAAICPTEALQFRQSTNESTLLFAAVLCTGCRLCVEFCPSRALGWKSPVSTAVLVNDGPVTLTRASRKPCSVCGRMALEGKSEDVCPDCRVKQAITLSMTRMPKKDGTAGAR